MNCEKAREHFADDLVGALEPGAAAEFRSHLLECRACREEADHLRTTWTSLERIPEPDPGPEMRARFYQMLDAYQQGRREALKRNRTDLRGGAGGRSNQVPAICS